MINWCVKFVMLIGFMNCVIVVVILGIGNIVNIIICFFYLINVLFVLNGKYIWNCWGIFFFCGNNNGIDWFVFFLSN